MKKVFVVLSIILALALSGVEYVVYKTEKMNQLNAEIRETQNLENYAVSKESNQKSNESQEENEKNQEIKEEEKAKEYDPTIMLVNKDYTLTPDYVPANLVKPYIFFSPSATEEERYMQPEPAKAIEELTVGAESEGIILYGLSGYRSYQTQQLVFDANVASSGMEYALQYVALPGSSEHQTGLAMDFATTQGFVEEGSVEAQWLSDNAHNYGFIVRYPKGKEGITGINYEPWHVRYVGKEAAKEIYEKDITFEEYFN